MTADKWQTVAEVIVTLGILALLVSTWQTNSKVQQWQNCPTCGAYLNNLNGAIK